MREVRMAVNGKPVEIMIPEQELLVDTLRERLHLTGTKRGCDSGHCGACTVLVDGRAVRSCRLLTIAVTGKAVQTVEGMGSPASLHPLQAAWIANHAFQCGFCTPGMLLAAKALLDRDLRPRRSEIKRAFRGHYCRCTGYNRVIRAVEQAAAVLRGEDAASKIEDGEPSSGVIGRSYPADNAVAIVTGSLQYASDLRRADMLHVRVLGSPVTHGIIREIDCSRATALAGVRAVFTARDIPGINSFGISVHDQPVLANDRVRYWGEPVAVVVADTEQMAEWALNLIQVQYQTLPVVNEPEAALAAGSIMLHPQLGLSDNTCSTVRIQRGEVAVLEGEFLEISTLRTPATEHAYLETEAGIAFIDAAGRLVLEVCTQGPHTHQRILSRLLAIPPEQIRVIQRPTGGAFGGKTEFVFWGILGICAWLLRQPVRLVYSRSDSFRFTSKRHPFTINTRVAVGHLGKFSSLQLDFMADTGAYSSKGPLVITRAAVHATGPYFFPGVAISGQAVYTNNTFSSAVRGFGIPQVAVALEVTISRLARRQSWDQWAFRYANVIRPGELTSTGQPMTGHLGMLEVMEQMREAWGEAREWQRAERQGAQLRGIGLAAGWIGTGKIGEHNRSEAWMELLPGGELLLRVGSVDVGQGSSTVLRQIAAAELGQPLEAIRLINGDTLLTPDADITSASRVTYFPGNAVQLAARQLGQQLLALAGRLFPGRNWTIATGGLQTSTGEWISLALLASRSGATLAGKGVYEAREMGPLDPATGQGVPYQVYAPGLAIAAVEVTPATGQVRVVKTWVCFNVGRALNPENLKGQLEGGINWGIGMALKEEFIPGQTINFRQYQLPTIADMPEMVCHLVEVPQPSGPFGALGVAEGSLIPVVPAIVSAVEDACKIEVQRLPIRPAELRLALNDALPD